jgi:hypothetical protein
MLYGCGNASVHELYGDLQPEFIPSTFFDGKLVAYGVVKDRSGKVIRRFTADIQGKWNNDQGTLDETFYFDDGEISKRFWELSVDPDTRSLMGSAGDVVGEAKGHYAGSSLNWKYTLRVPYKKGTIDIAIDDWLYLIDENRLINESVMRKFGFRVGSITLVIESKYTP